MTARAQRPAPSVLRGTGVALCLLLPGIAVAHAQSLASCAAIADDRARLACYDAVARAEPSPPSATPSPSTPAAAAGESTGAPAATALQKYWELRPDLAHGTFKLLPYRPLYALVHMTSRTNETPGSPTRALAANDGIHLDHVDAKLQLSLRTKLAEDILGARTDLWFGYTQQSYWQFSNTRYSSPFRETDYEPEAILIHPLDLEAAGVHARFAGLSFTHQSNGRGAALSRSWNRLIGDLALESGPWSLRLRPWVRVFDASGPQDDNPDIEDFVGRGEVIATYRDGGNVVTLTGRHSLRGGRRSHGSAGVDWAFPLTGSLNGHLQIFSGYGENLIDYNHRQTTIGIGVSFFD